MQISSTWQQNAIVDFESMDVLTVMRVLDGSKCIINVLSNCGGSVQTAPKPRKSTCSIVLLINKYSASFINFRPGHIWPNFFCSRNLVCKVQCDRLYRQQQYMPKV